MNTSDQGILGFEKGCACLGDIGLRESAGSDGGRLYIGSTDNVGSVSAFYGTGGGPTES